MPVPWPSSSSLGRSTMIRVAHTTSVTTNTPPAADRASLISGWLLVPPVANTKTPTNAMIARMAARISGALMSALSPRLGRCATKMLLLGVW
ncbi:Uncharacterised protein [Mycobacteroides abscessus subsp. abscessus]|nr:Uncharacterised protein [Mycobacteroides abscessus subsp. abscessus]